VFTKGFVYSDGWVDDARLVVLAACDAAEHGATILTRTRCVDARRGATHWHVVLEEDGGGGQRELQARVLVNATGPWAAEFLGGPAHVVGHKALRLVKGSHIVVPRLFDHEHAYIFQNPDKRIIFAIPYEGDFTLIGTTDVEHHGPVGAAHVDAAETTYLCQQASRYFERAVRPEDVVWSYSGVRPLLEDEAGDPSAVTRDYQLDLDGEQAPLLTVWGGKITVFRKLAEEAGDLLAPALGLTRSAWTRTAMLPGGDLSSSIGRAGRPDTDFARFVEVLAARHPALPAPLLQRLARAYGSRTEVLLGGDGLGAAVAPGLHEGELRYLHDHEWARSADDVLWRRSKLGLHLNEAEREAVARWCEAHWPAAAGTRSPSERAWS
jgi:glycerol-3-phosphate dehydrogenase